MSLSLLLQKNRIIKAPHKSGVFLIIYLPKTNTINSLFGLTKQTREIS